jgi:hypothetical protein
MLCSDATGIRKAFACIPSTGYSVLESYKRNSLGWGLRTQHLAATYFLLCKKLSPLLIESSPEGY